jgi:ATP-dependent helicase YprA (DUF1998 family)
MELTITKNGRKGYIRPFPSFSLSKQLESICSYEKKGAEFFPRKEWAIVKLYSIKNASFPWGLIDLVVKQLKEYNVIVKTIKQIKPEFIDNPKLRDYQRDAIKTLLENNGGILSMPTGSGKTFTCIEFLKHYQKKKHLL